MEVPPPAIKAGANPKAVLAQCLGTVRELNARQRDARAFYDDVLREFGDDRSTR